MKRVSISILFLALLLLSSMAFARTLYENTYENNPKHEVDGLVMPRVRIPVKPIGEGIGHGGEIGCQYLCKRFGYCCTAEEYAEFVKANGVPRN